MAAVLPAASEGQGSGTIGFAVVATRGATVHYTLSLPTAALPPALERELRLTEPGRRDYQALLRLIERAVHVAGDGRVCPVGASRAAEPLQPATSLAVVVEYRCTAGPRVLSIRDDLSDTLGSGYRTLAHIEVAGGAKPFTFTPDAREVRVHLVAGVLAARPGSYLLLGFEGMLTGLAQLLLIVALVAGADNLRGALPAVASFAAGYSATVVLAAAGVTALSPAVAGLLAAAAAAAGAALNLFPVGPLAPGAAASGLLGALQGFSLAQPLGETPMLPDERVAAWLHFNLGLAIATVVIATIALPLWLWLWRRWAQRARIGISWPVLLAGLALCVGGP